MQEFRLKTQEFTAIVTIENKNYINDPEGETIYHDLALKNNYSTIKSIRTAKILKIVINARTQLEAKSLIKKMCDDLRIYNPIVSDCTIDVSD